MLLSVIMVLGGLSTVQSSENTIPSKTADSPKTEDSSKTDAAPKSDFLTDAEIKEMYSSPSKFKNRTVELIGKVFSTPEYDSDAVYFQMWADPENSELNTIVKYADAQIDLSDGDYIKMTGIIRGEYEGENAFGAQILAPQIEANALEIVSYQEAIAPPFLTVIPNTPTQTQHGYSATIEKVELAEKETRVYIKVENNGTAKFSLYSFNSFIIQNGKQFEEETNYAADYPKVQTDLNVGVSTEGIFCYPAIENGGFDVVLEGSSENYSEKLEPFSFDFSA